jgi:hypothetical protein
MQVRRVGTYKTGRGKRTKQMNKKSNEQSHLERKYGRKEGRKEERKKERKEESHLELKGEEGDHIVGTL